MYKKDSIKETVTLDDGQSVSGQRQAGEIEISTQNADIIRIFIDNGTTGGKPATYDLEADEFKSRKKFSDWMLERVILSRTDRRFTMTNIGGSKYRVNITNVSGNNNETYRIFLESVRENN